MIPLDFVAGTHGHFVEYLLNRGFGFTEIDFSFFTKIGTSHNRPVSYLTQREIQCGHWFETDPTVVSHADNVIRIVYDQDDLLLVSSISLLRTADYGIDNDLLHLDTKNKFNNLHYFGVLDEIYKAYPNVDQQAGNIPRNILREFFKFGFLDPNINGYWIKLQDMLAIKARTVYTINLKDIHDHTRLLHRFGNMESWIKKKFVAGDWFKELHQQFMDKIPYLMHQQQCDRIVQAVERQEYMEIPKLTLLQESYSNARLESIFRKEFPFHQIGYFTNTKDVLEYIKHRAPDI